MLYYFHEINSNEFLLNIDFSSRILISACLLLVQAISGQRTNMEKEENDSTKNPTIPEGQTDSHVLSKIKLDEKGLSQKAGDTAETTDLGWNKPREHIEEPLIAGIPNEDLWMLIRRFDKVYSITKTRRVRMLAKTTSEACIQCQSCSRCTTPESRFNPCGGR